MRRIAALVTLSGALLTAGCSADAARKVATERVARSDVTEIVGAPGTVTARATATLTAAADGTVAALLVRDGQRVVPGTVLLRLDSPGAQTQLQQAMRARASAASGRVSVPRADLGPLQAQLDAAADAAFTAGRVAAMQVPDPGARQRALDQVAAAEARYRNASAAARAAVSQTNASVGSVQGALDALAASQQAAAAAQVTSAGAVVDALTVRSTIAGVVSLGSGVGKGGGKADLSGLLSQVPSALQGQAQAALGAGGAPSTGSTAGDLRVGSPVQSGAGLVTITDLAGLGLSADVDETDVLLVRAGTRAGVELDAVPDTSYAGTVTAVDLTPTTNARGGVTYRVRLSLQVPAGGPQPRPGMSAVVNLRVRSATAAVTVASSAVVRDGLRNVVYVVEGGRAHRRSVVLGTLGADRDEVKSGLVEGQLVVLRDADQLHDGQAVG